MCIIFNVSLGDFSPQKILKHSILIKFLYCNVDSSKKEKFFFYGLFWRSCEACMASGPTIVFSWFRYNIVIKWFRNLKAAEALRESVVKKTEDSPGTLNGPDWNDAFFKGIWIYQTPSTWFFRQKRTKNYNSLYGSVKHIKCRKITGNPRKLKSDIEPKTRTRDK